VQIARVQQVIFSHRGENVLHFLLLPLVVESVVASIFLLFGVFGLKEIYGS
jgi:hypothetical protein